MAGNIRINRVSGLGDFLRRLDSEEPYPDIKFDAAQSGPDPSSRVSALIPPRAANFVEYLEPGVRSFVRALSGAWDCTTYTSCEGHPPVAGFPAAMRTVGILPLSDDEFRRWTRYGRRLVAEYADSVDPDVGGHVALTLEETRIESAVGLHPAVDITFRPARWRRWDAYFSALDDATQTVVGLLANRPARSE